MNHEVSEPVRNLMEIDRLIHEPARLMLMVLLSAVAEADFLYLLHATGLTKGNLSTHLTKLEETNYITITKSFVGKTTRTVCQITEDGLTALAAYREQMQAVIDGVV